MKTVRDLAGRWPVVLAGALLLSCRNEPETRPATPPVVASETVTYRAPASEDSLLDADTIDAVLVDGTEDSSHYIVAVLGTRPALGWITPDGAMLSAVEDSTVEVIWREGLFRATRERTVDSATVAVLRSRFQVACDAPGPMTLFGGAPAENAQVLVLGGRLGNVTHGYQARTLTAAQIADVGRVIVNGAGGSDEALGVGAGKPFYSFHARYNEQGRLLATAMMLRDPTGRPIAHEARDDGWYLGCDGCTIPTRGVPFQELFRVLRIFEFPEFAYPVLLLDTSTFEGRALSLVTFTPELKRAELREYEYVYTCQ